MHVLAFGGMIEGVWEFQGATALHAAFNAVSVFGGTIVQWHPSVVGGWWSFWTIPEMQLS